MEIISSRTQERENPSATTSPASNGSSSTISSNGPSLQLIPTPPFTPTPNPIPRSHEISPYPTTFVQADTSTFKQVVQMLTGSTDTPKQASITDPPPPCSAARGGSGSSSIPPIKSTTQKKQGFKLHERRNSLKNGLMIDTLHTAGFSQNSGFSPRKPEILSPGVLDFPALVLSPATPMNDDTLSKSSVALSSPLEDEEKAIAQKKFYLHPSPRRNVVEPQLLPLFPVASPRVSGSSSSS